MNIFRCFLSIFLPFCQSTLSSIIVIPTSCHAFDTNIFEASLLFHHIYIHLLTHCLSSSDINRLIYIYLQLELLAMDREDIIQARQQPKRNISYNNRNIKVVAERFQKTLPKWYYSFLGYIRHYIDDI